MRLENKYAIRNSKEAKHFKTQDRIQEAYLGASQVFSDEFIAFLSMVSPKTVDENRALVLTKLGLIGNSSMDTGKFMGLLAGLGQVAVEFYTILKKQKGL